MVLTLLLVLSKPAVIVDSALTRKQALANNKFPQHILDKMSLVEVTYLGFDNKQHRGQLVVDCALALEVKQIFIELERAKYPIKKVVPIVRYKWNDQASINDNNTSAFNYRRVIMPGTKSNKLSAHAYGRAIDLNPYLNPYVSASGKKPRPYRPGKPGVLTRTSPAVKIFVKHGWTWGGNGKRAKDYQHFSKSN